MTAFCVAGQCSDHAAIRNPALLAAPDHSLHFFPEIHQALDLAVNLIHVSPGDLIDFATLAIGLVGQRKKLPDGVDFESEIARMADECQAS